MRILVLDEHPAVRRSIRQTLAGRFEDFEFGEARTGAEGLRVAVNQPWDLILLAMDVPGKEELDLLTELRTALPDRVLVLTPRAGFLGTSDPGDDYADVVSNPGDLVSAVDRILTHQSDDQSSAEGAGEGIHLRRAGGLSNREREVLRLIGRGKSGKETAALLNLSEKTISTYRGRILAKLDLKTTADLVRYAVLNLPSAGTGNSGGH